MATAWLPVRPDMKGWDREVGAKVGASGSRAGKGFAGGFKKALKLGGAAVGAALVGTGVFLKGAINQASDLAESVNAVNVTFGKSADEIHALGKRAATSLGLSRSEFNGLSVQFSAFATAIAGKGGKASKVIDDLTTRGADFASVMNLEVNEAMGVFQSGLAGETEPLRKFGIDLSAAAVEAHAYKEGIADAGEALTENQKVQARYSLLMKQTNKVQGDFKNTSDGLANSQRILSARWKDIQARVGQKLLPVMAQLSTWFVSKGLPAIERTWAFLERYLAPVFQKVGRFIADEVVPAVKDLIGRFTGANDGTNKLKNALQDAQPYINAVKTGFRILGAIFKKVVLPLLGKLADHALPVLGKALGAIGTVATFIWNKALQPMFRFLVKALGDVMVMWGKMLKTLGKVPGFGWAKKAGETMEAAGRKAQGLADDIVKIPPAKKVKVTADTAQAHSAIDNLVNRLAHAFVGGPKVTIGAQTTISGARAMGGPVRAGGTYLVGERGMELFRPRVAGDIIPNHRLGSSKAMLADEKYGQHASTGTTIESGAVQVNMPATPTPEQAGAAAGGRMLSALSAVGV